MRDCSAIPLSELIFLIHLILLILLSLLSLLSLLRPRCQHGCRHPGCAARPWALRCNPIRGRASKVLLCLPECQEFGGRGMASVVIFLVWRPWLLGASLMLAVTCDVDLSGARLQEFDELGQRHRAKGNPLFGWDCDHHSFVGGLLFVREQVPREVRRFFLAMRRTQRAFQHG